MDLRKNRKKTIACYNLGMDNEMKLLITDLKTKTGLINQNRMLRDLLKASLIYAIKSPDSFEEILHKMKIF